MPTVTKAANANAVVATGWTSAANAYASDNVYATAAPAKNGTISSDYSFPAFTTADIPDGSTINSVTLSAEWKVSATGSGGPTLGAQLRNGATALGTETTDSTSTADTTKTQVVTSGIALADLRTAGTVVGRIRASRGSSNTSFTMSLDYVSITVDYTAPTVPGAPTAVSATAGNTQATVSFTAPASNGGVAIDSYRVTASPGGLTATGGASPITITGLTNGTPYTFTVAAHNTVGWSAESAASAAVTPAVPKATIAVNPASLTFTFPSVSPQVGEQQVYVNGFLPATSGQVSVAAPRAAVGQVVMVALALQNTSGVDPTFTATPNDWTQVGKIQTGGSASNQNVLLARDVKAGDPVRYTFDVQTGASQAKVLAAAFLVPGAQIGSLLDGAVATWNNGGGNALDLSVPAMTATGEALHLIVGHSTNGTNFTPPAGYTEIADFATGNTDPDRTLVVCAKLVQAGAVAAQTVTDQNQAALPTTGVSVISALVKGGSSLAAPSATDALHPASKGVERRVRYAIGAPLADDGTVDAATQASRYNIHIFQPWRYDRAQAIKTADPSAICLCYFNIGAINAYDDVQTVGSNTTGNTHTVFGANTIHWHDATGSTYSQDDAAAAYPGDTASQTTALENVVINGTHPDWFLHKADTGRPFSFASFTYLFALDPGKTAVQNAVISQMQAILAAQPLWDGFWLDDTNPTLKYHLPGGTYSNITEYATEADYQTAILSMVAAVSAQLASTQGKLLVPNSAQMWVEFPTWPSRLLPYVSGAGGEVMHKYDNTSCTATYRVLLDQVNAAIVARNCEQAGKLFVNIDAAPDGCTQAARFGRAMHHMASAGRSAYSVANANYQGDPWSAEFTSNLGTPSEPMQQMGNGTLRRRFTLGEVHVNPQSTAQTVTFAQAVAGGSGVSAGSTSFSVPASSAVLVTY